MYRPDCDPNLEIIRSLGRGGTAIVHEARHHGLNRRVAIKCPLEDPESDPEALDFSRLARREYELIGNLNFPGLVRILEDPSPEYDHLVLELCGGPSLDQVLPIKDLPRALDVISSIAVCLEYLRAIGLVHGLVYFIGLHLHFEIDLALFGFLIGNFHDCPFLR